jgi:nitrogen fixation NifU-like protein
VENADSARDTVSTEQQPVDESAAKAPIPDKSRPSLDEIVAALQKAIEEQMRATYSATVIEEANNPRRMGFMEEADAHASLKGVCGDSMQFFLKTSSSLIEAASFLTDGCGPTIACGNMLARMVMGLEVDDAWEIESEDLLEALDGLPEEHIHCADLAVNTLRITLARLNRKQIQGEPKSAPQAGA